MKLELQDQQFVERIRKETPPVIGVLHPDWRGVRSSIQSHVKHCYLLEDNLTPESAEYYAGVLAETGCTKIVYGAFPLTYAHLIRTLHRRYPSIEQYITWHGSYMQSNEDYNWESFKGSLHLCKEGSIKRIGMAKKGMELSVRNLGVDAVFFSNFVDKIPDRSSTPAVGGPHLGLWSIEPIWRKNPYAMLAACSLIPGADVYVRGQNKRAEEFAALYGIRLMASLDALPMEQMPQELARMHLNLYVTLSECLPMTPLESFSVGSPCLIGPSSHLFEDWKPLYDAVVVPFPDRSVVIAEYIGNALANRDSLIAEYAKFAVEYNQRAKAEFASFINL